MTTRLSVLACLLAVALGGCRDDLSTLEVLAICAPPDDAEQCGMAGECDRYLASDRPWVFTTVGGTTNRLELFIQMNNQLPNNADPGTGRVNTNDFIAEEYVFNYRGANGIPETRHPANFAVPAASSFSPVVPVIPESVMARLQTTLPAASTARLVVVEMTVRGHLVSGSAVETGVFEVAADVFNADFPGWVCPPGEVPVPPACPNDGQTASIVCKAP